MIGFQAGVKIPAVSWRKPLSWLTHTKRGTWSCWIWNCS